MPFKDDAGQAIYDGVTDYICFYLFIDLRLERGDPPDTSYVDHWQAIGSANLLFKVQGQTVARWGVQYDLKKTIDGTIGQPVVMESVWNYNFTVPGEPIPNLRNPALGQQDAEGGTGMYFGVTDEVGVSGEANFFIYSPWYKYTVPVGCQLEFTCETTIDCNYGTWLVVSPLRIYRAEKPIPNATLTPNPYYTGITEMATNYLSDLSIIPSVKEKGMYWLDEKGVWRKQILQAPQARRFQTNRLGAQDIYFYSIDNDNLVGWRKTPIIIPQMHAAAMFEGTQGCVGVHQFGQIGPAVNRIARLLTPDASGNVWGVRTAIYSPAKKMAVTKTGQTVGGQMFVFKQVADSTVDVSAQKLRGPWVLSRNGRTYFTLASDWETTELMVWNDPNIVWADFVIGGDGSGLSVALFLTSAETDAAQTWQLKFKRAARAFDADSWPNDEDAVEVMTPENGGINFAAIPFSLVQRGNQDLFIFAPAGAKSYQSKNSGKDWAQWG